MVGLQRVGTILVAVSILAFVVELLVEAPELRLVSLAAGILLYGLGSLLGTADAERDQRGTETTHSSSARTATGSKSERKMTVGPAANPSSRRVRRSPGEYTVRSSRSARP